MGKWIIDKLKGIRKLKRNPYHLMGLISVSGERKRAFWKFRSTPTIEAEIYFVSCGSVCLSQEPTLFLAVMNVVV